jgi:hypothetical protein
MAGQTMSQLKKCDRLLRQGHDVINAPLHPRRRDAPHANL